MIVFLLFILFFFFLSGVFLTSFTSPAQLVKKSAQREEELVLKTWEANSRRFRPARNIFTIWLI